MSQLINQNTNLQLPMQNQQSSTQPSQTSQTAQTTQTTQSTPQTLSAQEILQTLEIQYQETTRNLSNVRESLTKSQEAVITAQDASFKAYQLLTVNKERHLINLIGQHQQQSNQYLQEMAKYKQLYNELANKQNTMPTSSSMTTLTTAPAFLPSDNNYLVSEHLAPRQDNITMH